MNTVKSKKPQKISGDFVSFLGDEFYKIANVQEMPPFFISLASSCDIFMFLSSNGSLAAGRQSVDNALCPYETDDKIHLNTSTGPKTIIKIIRQDGNIFWEPFAQSAVKDYVYQRNLYKNIWGNSIIYEEINNTLHISFYYQWELSERFGLVRTSYLENMSDARCEAEILDGVLNILPSGIPAALNDGKSCLTDAYKAAELDERTGLSIYSLTSKINDVPEPVEILTANVAYSICDIDGNVIGADGNICKMHDDICKMENRVCNKEDSIFYQEKCILESKDNVNKLEKKILLSTNQMKNFTDGNDIETEQRLVGRKGAYLTCLKHSLSPIGEEGSRAVWTTILDVALTHKEIAALQKKLSETDSASILLEIKKDIAKSTCQLMSINASGDGLQCTGDKTAAKHHYVNVLYNTMRGGIFDNGYHFEYEELVSFVMFRNKHLLHKHEEFFKKIKETPDIIYLKKQVLLEDDADLARICYEFLPLIFSRRHGDPSRPWNKFFIKLKNEEGKRFYHYEGNWRDIFQNWEAMCLSFPDYLDNIIVKFLNASTADGYNPYRISREGIDWEVPEPENPFSGLGYWGDHQIIYLLRLLEALKAHAPKTLNNLFDRDFFCYANVPYRIKLYKSILKNSKSTVEFDYDKHNRIMELTKELGFDGKLIMKPANETGFDSRLTMNSAAELDSSGEFTRDVIEQISVDNKRIVNDSCQIYYVSFIEKLLVPILAKISGLIAGGGIWLNTERPEWNDANNALVGNGLSMVTVYQLRKHIQFCKDAIASRMQENVLISKEVITFFYMMKENLHLFAKIAANRKLTAYESRKMLDGNGYVFSSYRKAIYDIGLSGEKAAVSYEEIYEFFAYCLTLLDYTIDCNKREDGMYHAYNILSLSKDSLEVLPLSAMLEGQTAIAASGRLKADELLGLIEAMECSGMYSKEQKSFYLYPIRELKTFMERNSICMEDIASSKLLTTLLADKDDTLIYEDASKTIRFNSKITDLKEFEDALNKLKVKNTVKMEEVHNHLNKMCEDEQDPLYKTYSDMDKDVKGSLCKSYRDMIDEEHDLLYEIFDHVFLHKEFTGRSGRMYKYEGIGCIYWHQNAKFLLSIAEGFIEAIGDLKNEDVLPFELMRLKDAYYRIREGLGFNKDPKTFGAFPLDPYSHTPYMQGAQQPGMTGQVKEEILSRRLELGILVSDGCLRFLPRLLRRCEFLSENNVFQYVDLDGAKQELMLFKGELAFTICQILVVYRLSKENRIMVECLGDTLSFDSLGLDVELSRKVFARDSTVKKIVVELNEARFFNKTF